MAFNLLVVDDSAVMRKMIIRSLRICGLPLTRAAPPPRRRRLASTPCAREERRTGGVTWSR